MSAVYKNTNILPVSGSGFRHIGPEPQGTGENAVLYGKGDGPNLRRRTGDWLNASRTESRDDTEEFAPLWDGPRLRPAFVAQLLGQIFPHAERPSPRSASAYGTYNSRQGMRGARTA